MNAIKINTSHKEQVNSFKYLHSIFNKKHTNDDIMEIVVAGILSK